MSLKVGMAVAVQTTIAASTIPFLQGLYVVLEIATNHDEENL